MNQPPLFDPTTLEQYRVVAMQASVEKQIARYTNGDLTAEQLKDEINRFQDKIMKAEGEEILVLYRQVMGLDDE